MDHPDTVTVACVQFAPELADRDATIASLAPLLDQTRGADIVVLPELCNSGYHFEYVEQALESSETVRGSVFLRYLQERCRDLDCRIVTGFNERDGYALYNSAVLVGPDGVEGLYRKLHLFNMEKAFFQPGDLGLPVFQVAGCTVGILVCFDWFFPESWRCLALQGADLVCHPSNLVVPGWCQKGVPVHCFVNRIHAATANRVGSERDLTFTGRSQIVTAQGEAAAAAGPDEETIITADLDLALARDKSFADHNHVLADRRPDAYGPFLCPDQK